jgi:tartrate/fumarate subfamily iron-sulfur-dependent hydro-lyase beta chain
MSTEIFAEGSAASTEGAGSSSSTPASASPSTQIKRLAMPLDKTSLAELRAGDLVYLTGTMYTLRDAGHMRLMDELAAAGMLPYGLKGATIFYAGPTPATPTRPFGAIGPTTASRMDFAAPTLYAAGVAATIGKGKRSQAVIDACREHGCVYFAAVGGVAAMLAGCIKSAQVVAYDDLGTEALRAIEVEDFPVYVEVDTQGGDLYRQIEA